MIKRKSLLTALICIILSLICIFGVAISGCGEYKPPENQGDTPVTPDNPDDPDEPQENSSDFTVQLVIIPGTNADLQNFTRQYYDDSDGKNGVHEQGWIKWETIRIQWTNVETGARHYSTLDANGKAACTGLDGDYKVTLTSLPTGFTYEPNINYADNLNRKIDVMIYKLYEPDESRLVGINENGFLRHETAYKFSKTGAYRTTLTSSSDSAMFYFHPSKQGEYSITTAVDVTENKIDPKVTLYTGNSISGFYPGEKVVSGGSENTYTKNILLEYKIPAGEIGNDYFFELSSTSLDGDDSYPLTVDFLIEREGSYTASYISTTVEVTEDFKKTPAKPEGTFTWAHANPVTAEKLVSGKTVILNTEEGRQAEYLKAEAKFELGSQASENDGYYYFFSYDEATNTYTLTDRVYAVLNRANPVFDLTNTTSYNVRYLKGSEDPNKYYNYLKFLDEYQEHCNSEGAYPVNREVAKFLQDVCIHYRIFNDGNGTAEGMGYNSDEKGMWLIGCGYYKQ